tara:strand:+ start:760 stop:1230 length:471 start_codon:yes stop_codon:yes gene_type:complete
MTELGENKMQISDEGIELIKHFEGCELEAYKCAAGVWTIGYGYIKGVQEGDKWSADKADFMLFKELEEEYEKYVNDYVNVPLNQCQYDALCSFVYNLGGNALKNSTLLIVLNSGNYEGVPEQIMRWNKAGGRVLAGLVRRRECEGELFKGNRWEHI